jgi:hypothetical protein
MPPSRAGLPSRVNGKERSEHRLYHRELHRVRGKASNQRCSDPYCFNPARDWAWIHGTDESDVNNYRPMCRSCHGWYDQSKLTQDQIDEIYLEYGNLGARTLAKIYDVDKNTIKRIWRRYGLIP